MQSLLWYIQQPGADDTTADLHLQAFVVPHSDGNYYSFGNKDELHLGNFTIPLKNKKGKYMTGYNHTSATLAWVHAKQVLVWVHYPMELHWPTFQGFSQPVNHNKVPGKSSSADIKKRCQIKNKKCYDGKTIDVVGVEMQQQQQQQQQQSSQASAALHQADASAAAISSSSSSSSNSNGNLQLDQNVCATCGNLCKDMETKIWDSYHHMNSSNFGSTNDWVLLPPPTFTDVWYDDAEDGQHHKVEPDGPDGEPQVHLGVAPDGQPHNMDPMIEVASAGHSHSCAIADSLHGSEDVGGGDSPPASSHGSFSDPEFMGPTAQWKCVCLEVMINLALRLLLLFVPHDLCMLSACQSACTVHAWYGVRPSLIHLNVLHTTT